MPMPKDLCAGGAALRVLLSLTDCLLQRHHRTFGWIFRGFGTCCLRYVYIYDLYEIFFFYNCCSASSCLFHVKSLRTAAAAALGICGFTLLAGSTELPPVSNTHYYTLTSDKFCLGFQRANTFFSSAQTTGETRWETVSTSFRLTFIFFFQRRIYRFFASAQTHFTRDEHL